VAERAHALKTSESSDVQKVRQLLELRGIGPNSAWLYVMEFFGWRAFRNRREVGALARKLLIDLWRYLESGVIPEGATLKV